MTSQSLDAVVPEFKREQDALIASFSQALVQVADNSPAAKGRLHASLAVALNALTASLANSVVAVGAGEQPRFAENVNSFRSKLKARVEALSKKAG